MAETETVVGILVTLKIDNDQALFVMVGSDGSMNRLGTGSESNAERDMFIGKADPDIFGRLRTKLTPELLGWSGRSLADPNPKGRTCELSIGFKNEQGQESMTVFRYGTKSQGPPPEVCAFVTAVVQETNGWYKKQKAMARAADNGRKKRFWEFWK